MPASPFRLLLLDPEAAVAAPVLTDRIAGLAVTPCDSLAAARAYLVGNEFDAVIAAATLQDGNAASLSSLREAVALPPLWVRAETESEADASSAAGAERTAVGPATVNTWAGMLVEMAGLVLREPVETESGETRGEGVDLDAELSRLAHDLNNPLAVISGNAQLAREVALATGADAMVVDALADLQAGVAELTERLGRLRQLRARMDEEGP